jgi:hypothetical protein
LHVLQAVSLAVSEEIKYIGYELTHSDQRAMNRMVSYV